ncbi:MAG: SRPBCC family protein [Chloroflexi bacterium]|nr:SRPBCC family protein [Chloroflexota bacterium]
MIPADIAPEPGPLVPPPDPAAKVVKVAQTVIIDRPCAAVFAFRSQLTNSHEWRRAVLSTTLDEPGPVQVGTRYTELRSGPEDSTQVWELEITEYELDCVLGIVARRAPTQVQELHSFARDGGSTRYTVAVEVTGGSISGAASQKQLLDDLLQLKWSLEGTSSGGWAVRSRAKSGS